MALINCPECGKENVSDKADFCPQCGFFINKYFTDLKVKQETEKRQDQQETKIREIMDTISLPEKPKARKWPVRLLITWFASVTILLACVFLNVAFPNPILNYLMWILVVVVLGSIFIIGPWILHVLSKDNVKNEEYEKAAKDPESYKREKATEQLGTSQSTDQNQVNITPSNNYTVSGKRNFDLQIRKKVVSGIGILIAIVLFCLGIFTNIPDKRIELSKFSDNGYEAYVGGDAYNIQIEAALRGGQIAGGISQRAIYISASGLILVISLFGLVNKNNNSATNPE